MTNSERLIKDCRLAAECLADTDTFLSGQAILREVADLLAAKEAEIERWRRAAVTAVAPLEAMRLAGTDRLQSVALQEGIGGGIAAVRAALSTDDASAGDVRPFQARVHDWIITCFGEELGADRQERNHRFIEEALELVQANGCTQSEAHQLVDYVYARPVGDPHQEVGGVMNTLAALCTASGLDLNKAAEDELARVWTKVEKIRAKQAAKPKHSPLPEATPPQPAPTVQEAATPTVEAAEWVEPMYTLAMLGLLTEEYQRSPDFRDAVDNALALSQRRFLCQQEEGGENG